jgi:hypothetical protein
VGIFLGVTVMPQLVDRCRSYNFRRSKTLNKLIETTQTSRHVKFDVWALHDTRAIKEGLVGASGLPDLTKTTFFDGDAAVYIPTESVLHCSVDYFNRIHSGVVIINLEENPNPLGAIARTLRLLVDWEVGLSRRLADFL